MQEQLNDYTPQQRSDVRFLGRMLPMLLFADDIVLMA